jgi:hypothetical protein
MKKIILQLSVIAICFFQAIAVTGQVTPGSVITNAAGDAQLSTWLNNNVSGTLLYRRSLTEQAHILFTVFVITRDQPLR